MFPNQRANHLSTSSRESAEWLVSIYLSGLPSLPQRGSGIHLIKGAKSKKRAAAAAAVEGALPPAKPSSHPRPLNSNCINNMSGGAGVAAAEAGRMV